MKLLKLSQTNQKNNVSEVSRGASPPENHGKAEKIEEKKEARVPRLLHKAGQLVIQPVAS